MPNESPVYVKIFFTLAFLLVVYVFYLMVAPFLVTVILALTVVSLFHPQYRRLNHRLGNRPGLSAGVMCLTITFLIIIPLLIFFSALISEVTGAFERYQQLLESGELERHFLAMETPLLHRAHTWVGTRLGVEGPNLTLLVSTLLERLAQYLLVNYAAILGRVGNVIVQFAIMIFSMFFFFRDGELLLEESKQLIPLSPEHKDRVIGELRDMTRATFLGIFSAAILQGLAVGLIFLTLGIANPILWGTAVGACAVVPILGSSAVWVPMGLYLLLTVSISKGIAVLVLGFAVMTLVDNVVRPFIIGARSRRMHLLLVFFSLLGGLWLFGLVGLVLGPLVTVLFVCFLDIYKIEFREVLSR